ncbi:hypothetical protein FE784_15745 [Paenibacillus hemerocallicola]|uniref:DUF4309 domain-containing protein n=1 Tax=Paenibacillus hemerocallicola TaxID=1172614 RepID=A0A5C4T844_9BACL|nr:hypothetical protein [Paenibacillus hemerocallicola]TNJ65273.1 hypothetical protein FE784_15745 [Paenibacillus hemerocallicola]
MIIRPDVRFWVAAVILGAVCTGCNTTKLAADEPSSPPSVSAPRFGQVTAPPPQLTANSSTLAVHEPKEVATEPPRKQEPAETPNPQPTVPTDKKVETSSDTKPPESKTGNATIEGYNVKKPSLMGIRLTDTKAAVKQKFDEPVSEFEMDDEKDPLTVFEYEGFAVGFNTAGKVEFIEITSKDVNAGLGGLRLGQKVKDAETALGKPDTNTTYALHYKADGTILKLDIDPKTEAIQSIKLFADSK